MKKTGAVAGAAAARQSSELAPGGARTARRPRQAHLRTGQHAGRHRPERTLLYQIIEEHYAAFVGAREAVGRPLPRYVGEDLEANLKCGTLEHGFLRVACAQCRAETPRDGSLPRWHGIHQQR